MKRSSKKKPLYSRQFSLVALGPSRSQEQIQQEIKNAVQEALQDYVEDIVQAEQIQGFLAGGLEWLWLFAILPGTKAAGLGFAGVLGKKAGDKLFDFFEKRLRQRNLQPKAAPSEATEDRSSHRTARGGKTAKNKRQKKSRKS